MLKKNTIANFVAQAYVNLLQFALVPIYIHYVGIAAFGLVGLYSILQAAFNLLDFGMTPTLTREVARYTASGSDPGRLRNFLRSLEWCALGSFCLVSVIVVLFGLQLSKAWITSREINAHSIHVAIAITAQVAALRLLEGIYRGCLNGLQQQVALNTLSIANATLRGLPTVAVLAFVSPTIDAFFYTQLAASVVGLLWFRHTAIARLPPELRGGVFDVGALSHFKRFAFAMFASALAGSGLVLAEKLSLTKILTLTSYGYYTLASMVASAIYSFIYPITQALAPRLAHLHAADREEELAAEFRIGAQSITCIAGSAAVWLIVFAEPVLTLWTRNPELVANTYRLVQLLTLANLLNGLVAMPVQLQIAYQHVRFIVISELAALLVVVPGVVVFASVFGPVGAAVCLIVLHLAVFAYNFVAGLPSVVPSARWRFLFFDILQPLTAAVCMALLAKAFCSALQFPPWIQAVSSPPFVAGAALLAAPRLRQDVMATVSGWRARFA